MRRNISKWKSVHLEVYSNSKTKENSLPHFLLLPKNQVKHYEEKEKKTHLVVYRRLFCVCVCVVLFFEACEMLSFFLSTVNVVFWRKWWKIFNQSSSEKKKSNVSTVFFSSFKKVNKKSVPKDDMIWPNYELQIHLAPLPLFFNSFILVYKFS